MGGARKVPERKEIPEELRWDLSPLYTSPDEWMKDLERVESMVPSIGGFRGLLSTSYGTVAECLREEDELSRALERLYTWSHLKHDEDLTNTLFQTLHDKASNLMARAGTESSYIVPELLSLPMETLDGLIAAKELEFARVPLRSMIRRKAHFLSMDGERLMAMAEEALEASSKTYRMLNDADLRFPSVIDEKGTEVELSHGRFISMLLSKDRRVRKEAFERFYASYSQHRHSFSSILEGELKKRDFKARARNYPSPLVASLDQDEVTVDLYNGLISAVHGHLKDFHRYVDIRKEALGLGELHIYDVYVPLVKEYDRKFEYEEAKELVMRALEPLGPDYSEVVKTAFSSRWIDVLESRGKRSGAYSSGCYDSPPFILMNFEKDLKEVFTLAHEMGHSVHSLLSNRNQPHITADYRIFVAEVASTLNEALLMDLLLRELSSREEQCYLVNHYLDSFKGTMFRQTMFAEFERDISGLVMENVPLTPDILSKAYIRLNREYFGPSMVLDEEIGMEWARIPHFYYNFYVYKYATSFAVANTISRRLLGGDKSQLDRYIGLLKAGCSKPPLELLRDAGVDLSTSAPMDESLGLFTTLVERFKGLV